MPTFYLDYDNGSDAASGADWANAWKTITAGALADRTAPGDVIRIAKSPAPVGMGDALWTDNSLAVVLDTAVTTTIENCETAWTSAGVVSPVILADTAAFKQGTKSNKITTGAINMTGALYAHKTIAEVNLSAYQRITFWFKSQQAIVADQWVICLCSDDAATTIVDSFVIPISSKIGEWYPLTITKSGGGNLGSSIKSIALYAGGTNTPPASKYIAIDNFSATTTTGLNLLSLISKNSAEQGGTEPWFGLSYIDGVNLGLGFTLDTLLTSELAYVGTTETVTTYRRETIKTVIATAQTTAIQTIQESGSIGNYIEYSGGWNVATNTQDGETFFDGQNSWGYGIYNSGKAYIKFDYINCYRYSAGLYFGSATNNFINHVRSGMCNGIQIASSSDSLSVEYFLSHVGGTRAIYGIAGKNLSVYQIGKIIGCTNSTISLAAGMLKSYIGVIELIGNSKVSSIELAGHDILIYSIGAIKHGRNNTADQGCIDIDGYNIVIDDAGTITSSNACRTCVHCGANSRNITINKCSSSNHSWASVELMGSEGITLNNFVMGDTNEVKFHADSTNTNAVVFSTNHNQIENTHKVFYDYGVITTPATDRPGGTGIMWQTEITNVLRDSFYPVRLSVAKIACAAGSLVTVKAWVKKSHATNIAAELNVNPHGLTGVNREGVSKTDDTNWEELTLTFTPTIAGVVEILLNTWAIIDVGSSYIEDLTITQG